MNLANEVSHRVSLFEPKVRKGAPGECWEWLGAQNSKGAGTFGLGNLGGVRSAHVAAWVLYRDPSYNPDGPYTFTHLCGRNGCVNPDHLGIIGPFGISNPQDVVRYIAQRYPQAKSALLQAVEQLPAFACDG